MKNFKKRVFWDFFIPVVILAAITILFRSTNLDMTIARHYFNPKIINDGFTKYTYPAYYMYRYGLILPIVCTVIAGIGVLAGLFLKKYRKFLKISVFVCLMMIIGPGLITNSLFKNHWGRPRPRQVHMFRPSSTRKFLPVLTKGHSKYKNSSFPSGHAAAAFFMIFPFFLLRDRRKKLAYLLLSFGLVYGLVMGWARVAQGGHFTSDILWAGGIDYLTAIILYYALKMYRIPILDSNFWRRKKEA